MAIIPSTRPIGACNLFLTNLAPLIRSGRINVRKSPLVDLFMEMPSALRSRIQAQVTAQKVMKLTNSNGTVSIGGKGESVFTVKYKLPKGCGAETFDCEKPLTFCADLTAGSTTDYAYADIVLDCILGGQVDFCLQDLQSLCEGTINEQIQEDIANELRAWYVRLEKYITKWLFDHVGNYANGVNSGTAPQTIALKNGNGGINPGALGYIKTQFSLLGVAPEDVIIIADTRYLGTALYSPLNSYGLNNLGTNTGVQLNQNNVYVSDYLDQTFNNLAFNSIVAFPKEHFAMFTKLNNDNVKISKGEFRFNSDKGDIITSEKEASVRNIGGLNVDFYSQAGCICESNGEVGLRYAWQLPFGMFAPPSDVYCPDALGGTSLPILHWIGDCGEYNSCL